jgi:hypothetical protein
MDSTGAIILVKFKYGYTINSVLHRTFILPNMAFGYGKIFPASSVDSQVAFYGNAHLGLDGMLILSPRPHADELAKICLMFDR